VAFRGTAVVMLKEHDYDTWRTLNCLERAAADQLYSADPIMMASSFDGVRVGAEPLQAEFLLVAGPRISDLIGEHRYSPSPTRGREE